MARLIDNEFSSYELSDDEALQGAILTITQKQHIQNLLSEAAMEKIGLQLDMTNPHLFIQQESSLKGQIDAYRHMLTCSEVAEDQMKFNAENL